MGGSCLLFASSRPCPGEGSKHPFCTLYVCTELLLYEVCCSTRRMYSYCVYGARSSDHAFMRVTACPGNVPTSITGSVETDALVRFQCLVFVRSMYGARPRLAVIPHQIRLSVSAAVRALQPQGPDGARDCILYFRCDATIPASTAKSMVVSQPAADA